MLIGISQKHTQCLMIMIKASEREIIDGLSSSLTSCLFHLTRLHILHIYSLICLVDVCGYIFGLILFSSFIQHVRSWCILTSLPTISVKQINNNGKNQKLTRCVTTGSVYLLYLESHKRQLISVFLICWHGVINQESLETTYPPKIIQKQNAILD